MYKNKYCKLYIIINNINYYLPSYFSDRKHIGTGKVEKHCNKAL